MDKEGSGGIYREACGAGRRTGETDRFRVRRPRSCAASGTAYKGMPFRVCVAPQLHGPAGLGASAPQLCGFRDCVQRYVI